MTKKLLTEIQNFSQKELSCKCCGAFNIDIDFMKHVDTLRDMFGVPLTVNSACRCKSHNSKVGGAKKSRHECTSKRADAIDLSLSYLNNSKKEMAGLIELFELANKLGLFHEVILYPQGKFLHLAKFSDKGCYYKGISI